jgi:hypothetical protein
MVATQLSGLGLVSCGTHSAAPNTTAPSSVGVTTPHPAGVTTPRSVCYYTGVQQAYRLVVHKALDNPLSCAMVYNDDADSWQSWSVPWFTVTREAGENWASWKRVESSRSLVITQSLVPSNAPSNWRQLGAQGAYDSWYKRLGESLVHAGLGNSIIRLAPEANFKYGYQALGSTAADQDAWRMFWARAAGILKSTPGSHFRLDWTVNAGYTPIPFENYYPGNKAVDIIGVDAYDELATGGNPPIGQARWKAIYNEPLGLGAVVKFAAANKKPLSVPEWGLIKAGTSSGVGDDPIYVEHMAQIFASEPLAYESYFGPAAGTGNVIPLQQAPKSTAVYRHLILGQKSKS